MLLFIYLFRICPFAFVFICQILFYLFIYSEYVSLSSNYSSSSSSSSFLLFILFIFPLHSPPKNSVYIFFPYIYFILNFNARIKNKQVNNNEFCCFIYLILFFFNSFLLIASCICHKKITHFLWIIYMRRI